LATTTIAVVVVVVQVALVVAAAVVADPAAVAARDKQQTLTQTARPGHSVRALLFGFLFQEQPRCLKPYSIT
jgi:hypothetical protein